MRLYFLRHGRAEERSVWNGDDVRRPLTEPGVELLRAEAETLRRLAIEPEMIITSPYVRAAQTAEIVAEHLDLKGRLLHDERLSPGFGMPALKEILQENEHAGSVMLVGHEPDFSDVISALTGGGRIVLKKGALARVDLPDHSVKRGALVWLIPATVLAC